MTENQPILDLARAAEVEDPSSPTSPGALWLVRLYGEATKMLVRAAEGEDLDALIADAAEDAVPIYTSERWAVFLDLRTYYEDLPSRTQRPACVDGPDGGPIEGWTQLAGVALREVAARFLAVVTVRARQDADAPAGGGEAAR